MTRKVSVKPLMKGLEAEEVRGGAGGSGGSLALPVDSGDVVVNIMDGVLADVEIMSEDVVLDNSTCQFQVTVGDGAGWVGGREEACLDLWRERGAPEHGKRCEENPTHAQTGSIAGAKGERELRDQFREAYWTGRQVNRKPTEVLQEGMSGRIYSEAASLG
jgi:hypothetical protein